MIFGSEMTEVSDRVINAVRTLDPVVLDFKGEDDDSVIHSLESQILDLYSGKTSPTVMMVRGWERAIKEHEGGNRDADPARVEAVVRAVKALKGDGSGADFSSIRNDLGDDLMSDVVAMLSRGDSEGNAGFGARIKQIPEIRAAAHAVFDESEKDSSSIIDVIESDYDPLNGLDYPSRRIVSLLTTMLAVAEKRGTCVIVVADVSAPAQIFAQILPWVHARICAGSINNSMEWLAGSDRDRGVVRPRDGIMTVFSPAYDRLHLSTSSAMSPDIPLDSVRIELG